jgi:3-hydroxymyristoyl/3-hydroxydecanoyl-(acyl carrier protein) dehydratase
VRASTARSGRRTEPQIVATHLHKDLGSARIDLQIPNDLCYFEGHFPGCALLPGIVQINWAVQFGREYFALPARFRSLSKIKFMRVITPGSPATLALEFKAAQGELSFNYRVIDALCSSGNIGFV